MTATVQQPGKRPEGSGYVQTAIDLLKLYNATGDEHFLVQVYLLACASLGRGVYAYSKPIFLA